MFQTKILSQKRRQSINGLKDEPLLMGGFHVQALPAFKTSTNSIMQEKQKPDYAQLEGAVASPPPSTGQSVVYNFLSHCKE